MTNQNEMTTIRGKAKSLLGIFLNNFFYPNRFLAYSKN